MILSPYSTCDCSLDTAAYDNRAKLCVGAPVANSAVRRPRGRISRVVSYPWHDIGPSYPSLHHIVLLAYTYSIFASIHELADIYFQSDIQ